MDSYLEPTKMAFPLNCHAELSRDDADETGVNTPVKIIWSYDESQAMKTVSQTKAVVPVTTAAASNPSTPSTPSTPLPTSTPTPGLASPIGSVTTGSPSQETAPPSNKEQSTAESPSQSTANPTSSTHQPSASSTPGTDQSRTSSTVGTNQPSTPSKGGSESDSSATSSPVASSSSSSNNTGAIVGGVIGGVAVLSFIVLGLLFLRRQKRNRTTFSPVTNNESSIWNFYFFNGHKKRVRAADIGPVYEKEGSGMARELEANTAGAKAAPYDSPVEMPVGSSYNR